MNLQVAQVHNEWQPASGRGLAHLRFEAVQDIVGGGGDNSLSISRTLDFRKGTLWEDVIPNYQGSLSEDLAILKSVDFGRNKNHYNIPGFTSFDFSQKIMRDSKKV
jgi:hypothetical protein